MMRISFRLQNLDPWKQFVLIYAIAFSVRAALVFYTGQFRNLDRAEMENVALCFARSGVLGNPYLLATGPTAHVCPGYAVVLGTIFRFFGQGVGAEIVKQLLACAITSFQYALMPALGVAFSMSSYAGFIGGLAGALLPLKFETETIGDWEAPWVAVMLLLLLWRMRVCWTRGAPSVKEGAMEGAAWGLAMLFSSAVLPVIAGLLAAGAWLFKKRDFRRYLGYASALVVCATLVLAPWALRNLHQLGSLIFTRSNFGLELQISNNDISTPLELGNQRAGVYRAYHPSQNKAEALSVRTLGEAEYNRRKLRTVAAWIHTNSARFVWLTARRTWYFWFPPNDPHPKAFIISLLSALAFAGLALLASWDSAAALMLGSVLFFYPLIYYVLQSSVRYKYPIDWIAFLLAGNLLAWALEQQYSPVKEPALAFTARGGE